MISFYLATTIPKKYHCNYLISSNKKAQFLISNDFQNGGEYLTIIPRARMGSESIAHEGERNNCFSKIQLVGQKYRE